MTVKPIPDGYPRVSPSLCVDGASDALDFYKKVLDAQERMCMAAPNGRIGHAEIAIGESVIMVNDPFPEMGVLDPKTVGGSPVTISVYVEDVDATFAAAIAGGATELTPVADQFYGDRSGSFQDPWGHRWHVMTHIEDLTPEELGKRSAEAMKQFSE